MKLDEAAIDLAQQYSDEGVVAFVVRTMPDGNVRFIGPRLPPELVAKMLTSAAQGYRDALKLRSVN